MSESRPSLLVFDVNETLSDMAPMGQRFVDVGAPEGLAKTWFAALLRDGFALTSTGTEAPFATIAREGLRIALQSVLESADEVEAAADHVLAGLGELDVHPDVADGLAGLTSLEIPMVTLSNGAASVAQTLLERAGLRGHFAALLSVEDAGIWKPAPAAYAHALRAQGVSAGDAMLVAVHPWDTDGAHRAGLRSAWINRTGGPYPSYFAAPDVVAGSLVELAAQLA